MNEISASLSDPAGPDHCGTESRNQAMTKAPLVSVIIPCYNHGWFLGDAIESVLTQSYPRREIIVVDDGSTDDSAQVASRYAGVELIRQRNRGLSASRNAGLEASTGDYLVFLDADDRLLPPALESGARNLNAHPECAFVYGRYRLINAAAAPMSASQQARIQHEHYLNMLRFNYIGMHATVMYHRCALLAAGGFDTALAACEDYDLFLRLSREYSLRSHPEAVAEYRQHDSNMSSNFDLMLKTSLSVLRSQWKYVRGNKNAEAAYKAGIQNWQEYYGKRLMKAVRTRARERQWKRAMSGGLALLRYYPRGVADKIRGKVIAITAKVPKHLAMKAVPVKVYKDESSVCPESK